MEICYSSALTPPSEVSPATRISAGGMFLSACGKKKSACRNRVPSEESENYKCLNGVTCNTTGVIGDFIPEFVRG
jgi:hypothetical protein